jgi:hypothetical protein
MRILRYPITRLLTSRADGGVDVSTLTPKRKRAERCACVALDGDRDQGNGRGSKAETEARKSGAQNARQSVEVVMKTVVGPGRLHLVGEASNSTDVRIA